MSEVPDFIERSLEIVAPIERVFDAIANPSQVQQWFCQAVEGDFSAGGKPILDFGDHGRFRVAIVASEPPFYWAMRGPAVAISDLTEDADPLSANGTLVEYRLESTDRGTRVTVRESGFQSLPADIAKTQYEGNCHGWDYQMPRLRGFVECGHPE
ncbi:MAG: SRPBCC domain-containing protein [Fimbriimonadaceae bacterium]|nr:SRPBCC domain-containing protein [Fimbriimonadaceae bacterium]